MVPRSRKRSSGCKQEEAAMGHHKSQRMRPFPIPSTGFVFATGIECSYPTIAGAKGQSLRVDELEKAFHYRHWQQDLALVRELGLHYLRYGPPYYRIHTAPDRYDW